MFVGCSFLHSHVWACFEKSDVGQHGLLMSSILFNIHLAYLGPYLRLGFPGLAIRLNQIHVWPMFLGPNHEQGTIDFLSLFCFFCSSWAEGVFRSNRFRSWNWKSMACLWQTFWDLPCLWIGWKAATLPWKRPFLLFDVKPIKISFNLWHFVA